MAAIIVATHGQLAEEFIAVSKMIYGSLRNVAAITFQTGESPEQLVEKYQNQLLKLDSGQGILVLADLLGGTPYNVACRLAKDHDQWKIVAGVNLPMLLEVIGGQDLPASELAKTACQAGQAGIQMFP